MTTTDVGIYASRERMLEIAEQIRKAFDGTEGHVDTVVYAEANSSAGGEVIITFSNDDSEPSDGGYQGNAVMVDFN